MRSRTVFTQVETLLCRTEFRDVSPLALELHVRAAARSVRTASPTFISDAGLDAIAPGPVTTMAAIDLCLAGLWQRSSNGYGDQGDQGGYVITDAALVAPLATAPLLRRV